MKRYAALFLSILLLVLTACGSPSAETPAGSESGPSGETAPDVRDPDPALPDSPQTETQDPEGANEPARDPGDAYGGLVERFGALAADPFGQDSDEPGETGFLEAARALGYDAVYGMGCLVEDLSGDGIPELAVGSLPEYGGQVNALYTLSDGQPRLVLEGWYRSSYTYLGEGRFFYYGSSSAAETGQGIFTLTPDGTGLECEVFYFTVLNSAGELQVCRNTTGSWNPAESEKADLSLEEFWAWDPARENLPLTPFSEADGGSAGETGESELPVSVRYLTEAGDGTYDRVILYDGPDACCLLFTADSRVTEFTLLELSVESAEDDGTLICSVTPAETGAADNPRPVMTRETPLAVQLVFWGDLPGYGISYVDASGNLRCFALALSGRDGSLLLLEAGLEDGMLFLRPDN